MKPVSSEEDEMLECFPVLHPDELFYSACSRYHQMWGDISHEGTMAELFGARSSYLPRDFPGRLREFCSRLPGKGSLTPDLIINEHSLFPFFRPFLPQDRAEKIRLGMTLNAKGGSIHGTLALSASRLPMHYWMRCCPQCMEEEKPPNCDGPFWHRSHQIFGVVLCHKHNTVLWDTSVHAHQKIHGKCFWPLERNLATQPVTYETWTEAEREHLAWLAATVNWLLNHQVNAIGPLGLKARLRFALREKGLITLAGAFRQAAIVAGFEKFYGGKLLALLGCCVEKRLDGHNWFSDFIRSGKRVTHPLHYLLLIHYLGLDIEEFLNLPTDTPSVFGPSPWPCLNPFSDHFRQEKVTECHVERGKPHGYPVGTFACSCGFIYRRKGPDKCQEDRFRKDRVIKFGPVWLAEMNRLLDEEGLSLRKTAKRLGIDRKRLGQLRKGNEDSQEEDSVKMAVLSRKRKEWEKIRKVHHEMTRTELYTKFHALYSWLYRNDRKWLAAHQPPRKKRQGYGKPIKDWATIDLELAKKVESATKAFKEKKGKPIRASIQQIVHFMFGYRYYRNHKLPMFLRALSQNAESVEDFQVRRLRYIASTLRGERVPVTRYRLIVMAGIGGEFKHLSYIQGELDRLCSESDDDDVL